jgi:hypothetical protein
MRGENAELVIDNICRGGYISGVAYEIEYADEFEAWWQSLTTEEQDSVAHGVILLSQVGVNLGRPYADTVYGSKFPNMKELRIQHQGHPYRVLYAFDPRRTAMLLIGGDKTGNNRWYEESVPKADAIYAQHLREIESE